MPHRILIRLTLLAALCASAAWAQPPHFDPRSFLSRMDRNQNGFLERDEIDGRAEGFLRRMKPDIDLDKGISIDKVAKMMQKSREERERDRERDHGRDGHRESGDQSAPLGDALVAGFGEESLDLTPVINFGSTHEDYVEISQANWEKARGVMEKYDRNKDGQLSEREREKTRWSDNPLSYDSNRDGRLSLEELAKRYAYHNKRDSQQDSSSSRDRDRGGYGSQRRSDRDSRGRREEEEKNTGNRNHHRRWTSPVP